MRFVKSNCRECNAQAYFRADSNGNISEISGDGLPLEGRCGDCYDRWFWDKFNDGIKVGSVKQNGALFNRKD